MISRSIHVAPEVVESRNWHELGVLVSDSIIYGDLALTAAVDFIQGRPAETTAALRPALDRVSPANQQTIHWILAYAAARQGHSDAVADALDGYLGWKPSRHDLKKTSGFIDAEVAFHAAISIKELASLWNDLGVLHFSFGYVEESIGLFEKCLACEPRHRYATINYTVALLTQGRATEAQTFYARAHVGPESPIHLARIAGAVQACVSGGAAPKPKDSWYWYRRCINSYEWRSSLSELFDGNSI